MLTIPLILRVGIIFISSRNFLSLLGVMKRIENNWTHKILHYYIYILKTLVKKNGQDKRYFCKKKHDGEHMNPNFKYINMQSTKR